MSSQFPFSLSSPPKALVFDLMGTCLDWHSSILPALQSSPQLPHLPSASLSQLALDWRSGFFSEIHERFQAGEPAEDIDVTHRRILDHLLEERVVHQEMWDEDVRRRLVDSWHQQVAWEDVTPAMERLRERFFL
jgi:FMN phosphatase YigB (HAD superfamily)